MTREVTVNCLIEQPRLQFALHGMGTWSDEGQVALEDDVEKLRQLVEACLADEASDAGDAAVVFGDHLRGQRIGLIVKQRAEFEDVDALVVEAEAFLAKQHRARTVELDRERDHRHHRRNQQQDQGPDDPVEQPFQHQIPVGDRSLEDIEHRDFAEIGIGAGPETQFVGVRGQADIHRQHPQLLEHLQNAGFGRDRQREQHEIEPGPPREFEHVVDLAELRASGAGIECTRVVAVIEYAENFDVRVRLRSQRLDEIFSALV